MKACEYAVILPLSTVQFFSGSPSPTETPKVVDPYPVRQTTPEVTKLGKVATEFDVYKNGANIILGGLVASVIAYYHNYTLRLTSKPRTHGLRPRAASVLGARNPSP